MVKVLCLTKPIWSVLFILIQILNVAIIISTIVHDYWFHQKQEVGDESGKFKGYLVWPKTGLNGICDDSGDSFDYCHEKCTDKADDYNFNTGICDRFKFWYSAGMAYLILSIIAIVFTALIAIMLCVDICRCCSSIKICNIYTSGFLMIFVLVLNFLAFTIWAGTVELKFSGCSHDSDYKGKKSVCGEGGAVMALILLLWLAFITPIYFIIAKKLRATELKEGEKRLINRELV